MNERLTDITILLDRSGSMDTVKSDTEAGLNLFVQKQKEIKEGDAHLTFIKFDSDFAGKLELERDYVGTPISRVGKLALQPRNWTPLFDAIGTTVKETGERLRNIPEQNRPGKVIFVIVTDGLENSSKEYTNKTVRDMIKHQEDNYNWQFVFIGANQDAFATGGSLGVKAGAILNYTANKLGTDSLYASLNDQVTHKRGLTRNAYEAEATSGLFFSAEDANKQERAKDVSSSTVR